jgi:hypothetical protein
VVLFVLASLARHARTSGVYDPAVNADGTSKLEMHIRDRYNLKLQEDGKDFTCQEVDLIKEHFHHYVGSAKLTNGDVLKADVTVGDDGSISWRTFVPR